jgi:hypothetical protein
MMKKNDTSFKACTLGFSNDLLQSAFDELVRNARSGVKGTVSGGAMATLPLKWKLDEDSVKHVLKTLADENLISYVNEHSFMITESGYGVVLLRRFPNLSSELLAQAAKMLESSNFSQNSFSYIQGLNEFFGKLRNAVGEDGLMMRDNLMNEVSVGILKSMDNNLFKTAFSLVSSIENIEQGNVPQDVLNDKPSETLASGLRCIVDSKTKVFHCSDAVAEMLAMTRNKIYKRNLPFPCIFVDVNFKYGKYHMYFGMIISSIASNPERLTFTDECGEKADGFHVIAMGVDERDKSVVYNFTAVVRDGLFKPQINERSMQFLATFACNFLDFLHDPNVRYVKASESYGHSHKILRARYERLNIDLEKTYFIKIEDPLRRYVDNYVRMRTMKGFSHRFWVRGHFRTLHADRYGEHIGKRLWIAPYIKGQGMLVEKRYDIEKREDDSHADN